MISEPFSPLRYADVLLVVLAAPVVIAAGLPALGYAAGAAAWTIQRGLAVVLEERGRRSADIRTAAGLAVGGAFGRAWLVALSILAVGLLGARADGAMAAGLVLAAFTVYFVTTLLTRSLERS